MKNSETRHISAQNNMINIPNYYLWTYNLTKNYFKQRIWDAGAGIGILAELIYDINKFFLLTDIGRQNLSFLTKKFSRLTNVEIKQFNLLTENVEVISKKDIDTIICLDVLEHLDDDETVLKNFNTVLSSGGHLIIKVPAHQSLYCQIDEASGHFRRYSKKQLKDLLIRNNFEIKYIKHMNMVGALLYLLKGKMLRNKTDFANTIKTSSFNKINAIVPLFELTEKLFPIWFGLSIIAVAKKK